MPFRTHKTLTNTKYDIFNESWAISVPPLKVQVTKTYLVIKVIKQIHMNWEVLSKYYEEIQSVFYDDQI